MKKILYAILGIFALPISLFAVPGELTTTPQNPTVSDNITITYVPLAKQQWMSSQDVFIYVCLEMDENGEWVKEKSPWSKSNQPTFRWIKNADGSLSYTISDIKTYFNLSNAELNRVSGMFVILKNEKFQTTDKYIKLRHLNEPDVTKFNGTVQFSVTVPLGTKEVYVAGTFGKEDSDLYWKHGEPTFKLKKKDATHFEGTINKVPADLEYLYVWGPRIDQTEFRLGHRPLGSRSKVYDIVEFWGDMTLNVTVPRGTRAMYVSGSFNNWGYSQMMDAGNNTWTFHVPPTWLGNTDIVEYKYYYMDSAEAGEKRSNRKASFEGFSTQYDEIPTWK